MAQYTVGVGLDHHDADGQVRSEPGDVVDIEDVAEWLIEQGILTPVLDAVEAILVEDAAEDAAAGELDAPIPGLDVPDEPLAADDQGGTWSARDEQAGV